MLKNKVPIRDHIQKELEYIRDYVKEKTDFDVTTKYRTRQTQFMMSVYLFYALVDEHTEAVHQEIADFVGRARSSITLAIQRHLREAKKYHEDAYKDFNPFTEEVFTIKNPFAETVNVMYEVKKQLEKDIVKFEKREIKSRNILLRRVKNDKLFQIISMMSKLDSGQLDIMLERIPPIVKMLPEAKGDTENLK